MKPRKQYIQLNGRYSSKLGDLLREVPLHGKVPVHWFFDYTLVPAGFEVHKYLKLTSKE